MLLRKIEESSCENPTKEKMSSDVENFKLEILRLEGENRRLKELAKDPLLASSQKKIETLEAMNNFLKSEKEEMVLEIAAKNKKIEILERRVKELTEMRTSVVNGSKNGMCDDADEQINELDGELRKTKHRVAELEVSDCSSRYEFSVLSAMHIFNATYDNLVVHLVNNFDAFLYSPRMLTCLLNDILNTIRRIEC